MLYKYFTLHFITNISPLQGQPQLRTLRSCICRLGFPGRPGFLAPLSLGRHPRPGETEHSEAPEMAANDFDYGGIAFVFKAVIAAVYRILNIEGPQSCWYSAKLAGRCYFCVL